MRRTPTQAIKVVTIPSGATAKRVAAILSALTVAEVTVQGERRLHVYTLANGDIAVYKHRYGN